MKSAISLFISLLAVFFATQMAQGAQPQAIRQALTFTPSPLVTDLDSIFQLGPPLHQN